MTLVLAALATLATLLVVPLVRASSTGALATVLASPRASGLALAPSPAVANEGVEAGAAWVAHGGRSVLVARVGRDPLAGGLNSADAPGGEVPTGSSLGGGFESPTTHHDALAVLREARALALGRLSDRLGHVVPGGLAGLTLLLALGAAGEGRAIPRPLPLVSTGVSSLVEGPAIEAGDTPALEGEAIE